MATLSEGRDAILRYAYNGVKLADMPRLELELALTEVCLKPVPSERFRGDRIHTFDLATKETSTPMPPLECETCRKWKHCACIWVSGKYICRQHTDHKPK